MSINIIVTTIILISNIVFGFVCFKRIAFNPLRSKPFSLIKTPSHNNNILRMSIESSNSSLSFLSPSRENSWPIENNKESGLITKGFIPSGPSDLMGIENNNNQDSTSSIRKPRR